MTYDFIERMCEDTMADCILKVALRKFFSESFYDSYELMPSEIPCDQTTFMSITPHLKDVCVTIGDGEIRLWDFIEPVWGDYSYCILYPSDDLKKLHLRVTFKK